MPSTNVLEMLTEPSRTTQIISTEGRGLISLDDLFEAAHEAFPDRGIEMDAKGNIIVAPLRSEEQQLS